MTDYFIFLAEMKNCDRSTAKRPAMPMIVRHYVVVIAQHLKKPG